MNRGRLEAFSDGVLAIIITVMVLQLREPAGATFSSLRAVLPDFLGYVLSFVFIGIYWNNHHHLLKTVDHITASVLWANLDLLFWLSLLPFTTSWMTHEHFATDTVVIYGAVLGAAGVGYYVLQIAIIHSQGPNSALKAALGSDLKGKASIGIFVVGIVVAFPNRWVALGIFAAVPVMWMIPDRRLEPVIETMGEQGAAQ